MALASTPGEAPTRKEMDAPPKIFEANREVIKDANLIFPETSSRLK
jgi:hypothetical protein